MAGKTNAENVTRISGEWLCRDMDGWRVRVPTPGGHNYFSFAEYGGNVKALNAARAFHAKMVRQLEKDREYYKKHGEMPEHETLNIRNRSGVPGCHRMVTPNLSGRPNITWFATWCKNGRQHKKGFSTFEHGDEATCKKLAIEYRAKMLKK